jgi:sodium transport system permease protein
VLNQTGEVFWHLWVPALGQHALMTRVLKGEAIDAIAYTAPLLMALLLTTFSVWLVGRKLQTAALR